MCTRLPRDSTHSEEDVPPFSCLCLPTLVRLVVTSNGIIQYILYISFPNRDIEKIIAFSGIFDLSPRSGVQPRSLPAFHTYPYKTLFPTIRLTWQESDTTFL
ncbi:hypothetical protein AVEN_162963-1 [Araneus ventricosus]|uniref:Uncharacterized protein n=1 Tax=Araneus ventricosus TaxID=182803 RepID=A0A4Y2C199_ARAVE|nr:hypothetical protein AVEN_162963-1 [Araneus ventricosus]